MQLAPAPTGRRTGRPFQVIVSSVGLLFAGLLALWGAFDLISGHTDLDYSPRYVRLTGGVLLCWAVCAILGCVISLVGRPPRRWWWAAGIAGLCATVCYPLYLSLSHGAYAYAWVARDDARESSLWFVVLAVLYGLCALGSARRSLRVWLIVGALVVSSTLVFTGLFPPPR